MKPILTLHAALLLLSTFAAGQSGTGLTGQYYDNADFTTLKTTRVDATVDFAFGAGLPAGTAITSGDTFSIAWSGQVEPEFTDSYTFFVTANDGARLWVNDLMVVMRTFDAAKKEMRGQINLKAGQRVNLRLEFMEQTGDAGVKLEWSCASRGREVIPAARLYPAREGKAGGSILREHWSGITGQWIYQLTGHAKYPNKPGGREFITSFECLTQNWADSYGTRVTGFIVPPETGSYTFAVSGDDTVQLRLSTDESEANGSLIASLTSATAFRAWGTPSVPRELVQGRRYYVELLHKEGTGTDHWSVGWKKPGDSTFSVVPGSALVQAGLNRTQPEQAKMLDTLAQDHPRLFATAERFARLKAAYESGTQSKQKAWAAEAVTHANKVLKWSVLPYTQGGDTRQNISQRIHALALAWHLTGNSAYAERAWLELENVANNDAWPDWHFPQLGNKWLDMGEMTFSCGIAYDWLYHYWTPERRTVIRTAIINKGLNIAKPLYASGNGFTFGTNNWNGVCNGGMSIGALAVGTESETLVEEILKGAIDSARPAWKRYTADNGAWFEGPGYWDYQTTFAMRMAAALENGLGSDFGLSATQGASEAGYAQILPHGTANLTFNFSDCPARDETYSPVFQWMARRYNMPIYNGWENAGDANHPRCLSTLDALWWNEGSATAANSGLQPDAAFLGEVGTGYNQVGLAALRGRWNDNQASFVASKGGNALEAHAHTDAGSFVMDALGKRWFHDLGQDDYGLPGYGETGRDTQNGVEHWDYYRLRLEGHNTLAINPDWSAGVNKSGTAPLIAFQSAPGGSGSFYIHDLTPVHLNMQKVWRGVRLMGTRDQVLVQDEIQAGTGKTVWWFAHYKHPSTTVVIAPDGTSATMTQGTSRLWCKIVSGGGTFTIRDAVPLPNSPNPITTPQQDPNTDYKKLAIQLNNVTNTTLALWFVPLSVGEAVPTTLPALTPLSTWTQIENRAPTVTNPTATLSGTNPIDIDLSAHVTDDGTPLGQLRFSVSDPVNGSVILLADGRTARFTPAPGHTGVPSFTFTVTDTESLVNTILVYDFEPPDGTSATDVPDSSGAGRTGTIGVIGTGSATLTTDVPAALARNGRGMDLTENGLGNAARISRTIDTTEIDWNSSDWTFAGWFKRRKIGDEDMILHLGNGGGYGSSGEELYLMARGESTLTLHHQPGADVSIESTAAAPGVWHHFAVVRNGTSISLYLNGTLVGTDNAFTLTLNQTPPLHFGGHANDGANTHRWFDGSLDELIVVGSALSPAQISTLATGMTARHLGGASSSASLTLSATPVTHHWTSTTSGNWSTGANWQGGVAPTSATTTIQFFNAQNLATGLNVTANHDLSVTAQVNALVLGGTTTGSVTVNTTGGAIQLVSYGGTPPNVTLTAGSGLTYNVANPLTLVSDTTFAAIGSGRFVFQGNITGPGGLCRTGSGSTLILAGNNTYTGNTFVNAGTLEVKGGTIAGPGYIDIGSVGNAANFTLTSGSVTAGSQFVIGAHGSTGTAAINGGTLQVNGTIYLGGYGEGPGTGTITQKAGTVTSTAAVNFGGGGPNSGIYHLDGGTLTTAVLNKAGSGTATFNFNGGTLRPSAASTIFMQGLTAANVQSGGALIDTNGFDITISQALLDGGGGLTKAGTGTLILAGNNTYTGATTVTAGTLSLVQPCLANSANVELSATATLNLQFAATDTIKALYINSVQQATGTWGRIGHPSAQNTTALITGDGLLQVTTGPAAGFASWASGFLPAFTSTGADLDLENDGLASGIEWVVGGDPTLNDAASVAPTFDNTSDPNNFLFTYRRRDSTATDPNTTIVVVYGSDLTGWTAAQNGVSGVSIDDTTDLGSGFHQVKVVIPRTLAGGSGKLFARLRVAVATP